MNGNTFDVKTTTYGHAAKVWRSVRHVFPAGGVIENVSDFVAAGKIPAGTPVKYYINNDGEKAIVAYKDSDITGAQTLSTLGINGYLQEDAVITDSNTIATGTVVYAGELYEHMFAAAVVTALKGLTTVPQIVWVV